MTFAAKAGQTYYANGFFRVADHIAVDSGNATFTTGARDGAHQRRGRVTFGGGNSYAGATIIESGTLRVRNDLALGVAGITAPSSDWLLPSARPRRFSRRSSCSPIPIRRTPRSRSRFCRRAAHRS